MMKVSIFGCGVQKGGTTSLFAHLFEHPQLQAPHRKEIHFFDDESHNWDAPVYADLYKWFDPVVEPRLRFDITPVYSFWPSSIQRIKDYNRDAKIICLFRDPIERAWSHWSMEYARQLEVLPFSEAIRSGRDRFDGLDAFDPKWRVHSYVERGFYAHQIVRMRHHFADSQLLFLRSRDLKADNSQTLATIADFLQIDPFPASQPKIENVRADIAYPSKLDQSDQRYLSSVFYDDVMAFSDLTQLDTSDWLTRRLVEGSTTF